MAGAVVTFGLLSTGILAADQAKGATTSGFEEAHASLTFRGGATAIRGSVDLDGNDIINGSDQSAVVTVKFLVRNRLARAARTSAWAARHC